MIRSNSKNKEEAIDMIKEILEEFKVRPDVQRARSRAYNWSSKYGNWDVDKNLWKRILR